jgi:hypothetical protein
MNKIIIFPVILGLIIGLAHFAIADSGTFLEEGQIANTNVTNSEPALDVELSPNVAFGYSTSVTSYAIQSVNTQASAGDSGIEYGMANDYNSYFQQPKTDGAGDASDLTDISSGTDSSVFSGWTPMGGSVDSNSTGQS